MKQNWVGGTSSSGIFILHPPLLLRCSRLLLLLHVFLLVPMVLAVLVVEAILAEGLLDGVDGVNHGLANHVAHHTKFLLAVRSHLYNVLVAEGTIKL